MSNTKIEQDETGMSYLHGFKLSCIPLPKDYVSKIPTLKAQPGFKVWTKNEITDAIKEKGFKSRRKQFKDEILNQGAIGSCASTGTTGAFLRANYINGATGFPRLDNEFLYAQVNGGQDNGSMLADNNEAIRDIGIIPMKSSHRYNIDYTKAAYKPEDYEEAKKWQAEGVFEVSSELELATILLSGQGAGLVAVNVGNNFSNLDSNGYAGASNGPGNHAVCAQDVEIIDGNLAFDIANSWSKTWGDEGFFYADWKRHFTQTVGNHRFFVIVSSKADFFKDNAPVVQE